MTPPTKYDFRIDAWLPNTLPMARLAEYLASLAKVFGHQEHVHFVKVRKGSAIPEIHVEETTAPKVQARLKLVGHGNVPEDAAKSMLQINNMLREDNASAVLRVKGGAQVIWFPGCKTPLAEEAIVHEVGELIGTVIKVGGKDETVPLLLQDTDGTTYPCTTNRTIAKELARHIFGDLVRVQGTGKWRRTAERAWKLDDFKLKSWEPIDQTPLLEAVAALRAVKGSKWNEFADPQDELKKLRKA
jgi:hypothetical protein